MRLDSTLADDPRSVRQMELELRKTRLEAEAARLEARATELLMWLERVGHPSFDQLPEKAELPPLLENVARESPWQSRELAAWEHLARSGWCRDLLDLHTQPIIAEEDVGSIAVEVATQHAVVATQLPSVTSELVESTTDTSEPDTSEPEAFEAWIAPSPETPIDSRPQETQATDFLEINLPAFAIVSAEHAKPWQQRTKEWSISLLLHLAVLIPLGVTTFAANEPRDVLAFVSGSATESELEPIETVHIEASQAPSVNINEPSSPVSVDPMAAMPSTLAVSLSSPGAGSPTESLSDLLMPATQASKSASSSLKPMKSDASAVFCGVSSGGSRLCFLVDSSKSMDDGRFEAARGELLRAIDQLSADKRFYVIFFDIEPAPMCLNSSTPEKYLAMATVENKRALRTWAMTIGLERGLAPDESLKQAIDLGPEVIFLLTDGEFPDRTEELLKDINHRESLFDEGGRRCIIHTIAFHGKEGIEKLSRIAKAHGGTFKYVPKP